MGTQVSRASSTVLPGQGAKPTLLTAAACDYRTCYRQGLCRCVQSKDLEMEIHPALIIPAGQWTHKGEAEENLTWKKKAMCPWEQGLNCDVGILVRA